MQRKPRQGGASGRTAGETTTTCYPPAAPPPAPPLAPEALPAPLAPPAVPGFMPALVPFVVVAAPPPVAPPEVAPNIPHPLRIKGAATATARRPRITLVVMSMLPERLSSLVNRQRRPICEDADVVKTMALRYLFLNTLKKTAWEDPAAPNGRGPPTAPDAAAARCAFPLSPCPEQL